METPSGDAVAAVVRCWLGDARQAFDACCAATPDDSCANEGRDWPAAPGVESCAWDLFAADDQCRADARVSLQGDASFEEFIQTAHCWMTIAHAAFQRCCAADPIRCDVDDVTEDTCTIGVYQDGSCVSQLYLAHEQCLTAAAVSLCDWRDASQAIQAECWQEGLRARDACCVATPDWSCD